MIVGHVRDLWRFPVKSMAGERLERVHVGADGCLGDRRWAVRNRETGEIHNAKRFPILMQCAAAYRTPPHGRRVEAVDITFPDGTVLGSDDPALAGRLSELIDRPVALHPVEPASNRDFYRRRAGGAALLGRIARFALGRRMVQWGLEHGAGDMRSEFGRTADEPMPDLRDIPPGGFEFQTPPGTYFDLFPIHLLTTSALTTMQRLNPSASWDTRRFRPNILIETTPASGHVERSWRGRSIRLGTFEVRGELPTMRCAMPMHAQREVPADPSVLRTIVRDAAQCLGLYASVTRAGLVALGDPVDVGASEDSHHAL
jgi:uncharacterized protein YcbX